MSRDLNIGLSKKQLQKLLNGEEVGKRPYQGSKFIPEIEHNYVSYLRVRIVMLSDEEEKREPKDAFTW